MSVPEASPGTPASRAQELQDIMEAYALLRDPAKRAAYDEQRPTPTPPAVARPAKARSHAPAGPIIGPVLIIGPVRWESPPARARYPQAGGSRAFFNPWWIRQ
ncbi:curved DNA-binding protein CbpA [Arthrobacter bambusae]|nr:curved DNA-binding protein CbpA [Arthrobacter bambusae]